MSQINSSVSNYMSYSDGGAYDEDNYSCYATANYGGTERTLARDDPSLPAKEISNVKKPAFEVVGGPAPQPQQASTSGQSGSYYSCPVCGETASRTCGCEYRDASCSRGHSWFSRAGKREMGISPNHRPVDGPAATNQVPLSW